MSNPHKGRTGLDRVIHAAGYSMAGLTTAYRGESAFRQEFWLAVAMTPVAWITRSNPVRPLCGFVMRPDYPARGTGLAVIRRVPHSASCQN